MKRQGLNLPPLGLEPCRLELHVNSGKYILLKHQTSKCLIFRPKFCDTTCLSSLPGEHRTAFCPEGKC